MEPMEILFSEEPEFFKVPRSVDEICEKLARMGVTGFKQSRHSVVNYLGAAVSRPDGRQPFLYRHGGPICRFATHKPNNRPKEIKGTGITKEEFVRVAEFEPPPRPERQPNSKRQTLYVNEAAAHAGVSRKQIEIWIAQGKIEFSPIGTGSRRVYLDSLNECIRSEEAVEDRASAS